MFIIVMPTVSAASRKGPPHIHLPLFPRSKINSSRSYRLQGLPKTCAVSATLLSLHTAMGDSGTSGYICPCVVKSGRLLPAVVALECRRVPVQHACVEAKCLAVMQHPAAYCMSFFSCTREHATGLGSRYGGIQALGADNKQLEWQAGAEAYAHSREAVYTDFISSQFTACVSTCDRGHDAATVVGTLGRVR
jgi:hypothetical protein